MKKRIKLPNGYGSVVYYGDGRRRRPWVVKKTIAGRQKIIGKFATYAEGLAFLAEYNKNPMLFSPSLITFSEVYELMAAERYPKLAPNTCNNYRAAYKHCKKLYGRKFAELKISDLQAVIREMSAGGTGYASQKKCRQLLHHIYTYAVKYELIPPTADISQYIDIDQHTVVYPKQPFNTRQINRVKALANSDNPLAPWAMVVVIMCYSGPRTGELLAVLKSDVKLKQRYYIIRDSKTAAGRNRAVPISRKVLPYFAYWMSQPGKTLIADPNGNKLNYSRFRTRFNKAMKSSRCKHTPHECRHTCATWLDNAGANKTAVKRILGHASQDVTTGVYTHKSLHDLKRAIDLI